jgi:predicted phosphodiesterase
VIGLTRTAILSDIHGNLAALEAVMEDIRSQNVDEIVCLGDVVGYGPRPRECLDWAMSFAFTVLGNHDSSAVFDPEGFNNTAERAIFWTREQLHTADRPEDCRRRLEFICRMPRVVQRDGELFVHGSPRGPTNEYVFPEDIQNPRKMEKLFSLITRVCFQGHTHVPGVFNSDNRFVRSENVPARFKLIDGQLKWMVNVGSVGQPRDGDPRSCYVIWEDSTVTFRRVPYDIERTVREIEAEPDLDDMLGYRLREGR